MGIQSLYTNSGAMSSSRYINLNSGKLTVYQEQLATGKKVADPSKDPASAAVGYMLESKLQILGQASTNSNQATALVQLSAGALGSTEQILARMAGLAAQANSDSLTDGQRLLLNNEYEALLDQIDKNAQITWSGVKLFTGGAGTLNTHSNVNASLSGSTTISTAGLVGALSGFNVANSMGFISGSVKDVTVKEAGVNLFEVNLKVGDQTFRATVGNGAANTTNSLTLISVNDANNRIVFDTNNANAANLNSATNYNAALREYLGLVSGSPASFKSGSATIANLSYSVGAGLDAGTWGLTYTYNSQSEKGMFKLTNGSSIFTREVKATDMTDISGSFFFDNGFKVTASAFDGTAQSTQQTFNVTAGTSFDRSFQIGESTEDIISLNFKGLTTSSLGLVGTSIATKDNAVTAAGLITAAIDMISLEIAKFGGKRSQLQAIDENLRASIQNQNDAKATFTDTDIPTALMESQKYQSLLDTSSSMLQNTLQRFRDLSDLVRTVFR